ncbi:MAG: MATE family efflux transporter [Candidatus Bipolaricaulaceae bacterium]
MRVGVPSSLSQLSMSLAVFSLNWLLPRVGGEAGVAVFTSGWRIVTIGTIPLLGLAAGVIATVAAAYGSGAPGKLRQAYLYAVRFGLLVELGVAGAVAILAPWLALLFTYWAGSTELRPDLVAFLRWMTVFLPTVPLGMLTSALFNGMGKGERALVLTGLRTLVLQVLGAYGMAVWGNLGLSGVWWGIVAGNVLAGLLAFAWGWRTVDRLAGQLPRKSAAALRRRRRPGRSQT